MWVVVLLMGSVQTFGETAAACCRSVGKGSHALVGVFLHWYCLSLFCFALDGLVYLSAAIGRACVCVFAGLAVACLLACLLACLIVLLCFSGSSRNAVTIKEKHVRSHVFS